MGKASRKKKVSTNEALSNQGRHEKELKPSQKSPSKGSLQKTTSIIAFIPILIIVLVSCAVYFNAIFNKFVWDDANTMESYRFAKDITSIPDVIAANIWGYHGHANYYRPMIGILYELSYELWNHQPWGFHLVNILFHTGVSILVFLIISQLLRESVLPDTSNRFPAFIGALLYATHPIHTESVAWVSGITDISFSFFYLLSFLLYVLWTSYSGRRLKGIYPLSVGSFLIACFFKEPAVTLPLILIAYDYSFRKTSNLRSPVDYVKRYLPYLLAAGVYFILRFHALGGFASGGGSHEELGISGYFINVFPFLMNYFGKLILPVNLKAFYVFHPLSSLFEMKSIISVIITTVFVALVFWASKRNRPLFFGLLLIIIPLLPALYFRATGATSFAERYLYLPSFGFVFIVVLLTPWTRISKPGWVTALTIFYIVVIGLYSIGTISRNSIWKDDSNLWSDTVKKSPDSTEAHYNVGFAYDSKGQIDMAIEQYQTALRLKPDFAEVHNNLGNIYQSKGQIDMAIEQYQTALRLKPDYAEVHNNLGIVYASKGKIDMAIEQYQTALRLKPDFAEAHYNLGNACKSKGKIDMAIEQYQTALRLKPDNADAHFNLGFIYLINGAIDIARREYELGLKIKPYDYMAQRILNNIKSRQQ